MAALVGISLTTYLRMVVIAHMRGRSFLTPNTPTPLDGALEGAVSQDPV
jgi:hypothetical protein